MLVSRIFFLTLVEALFDEDNENQPALVRFVPTENENDEIIFDDINVVIEENVQDYHFAINGKSWAVLRWHFPHLVPKIIQRGMKFSLKKCTCAKVIKREVVTIFRK